MKINVAYSHQFDFCFCQGVAAPDQEHGQHQEEEEGGGGRGGGLDTSKGGQLNIKASYLLTMMFFNLYLVNI